MPAPILTRKRVRLRCDADSYDAPKDAIRNASTKVWASNDLQFEIGAFLDNAVVDASNWQSLTVEIKPQGDGPGSKAPTPATAALASKTVTEFDATLDQASWDDLSKQHALVAFSADEMAFALAAEAKKWLIVTLVTTDGATITLSAGVIEVMEDGYHGGGPAPDVVGGAWSKAESDARYVRHAFATLAFAGELTDEQAFGYFRAQTACKVIGAQLFAQIAPTGAAVTIDLLNGAGAEQTKVATLADGASYQETIYGTALTLAAGDVVRAKVKSVGSTLKGEFLTCNLIVAPAA